MIGLDDHIALVAGWARGISTANGYRTDIGAGVVTERIGGNGDDKSLLVGVYLADLTPVKTTPQRRDWTFDIAIEGRIPVRSTTAEQQARAVLEDLAKCVPTKTTNPADNLQTLEIAGTSIARQPDGVPYIVVSVTVRATCYEYITSPA